MRLQIVLYITFLSEFTSAQIDIGPCVSRLCPPGSYCNIQTNRCISLVPTTNAACFDRLSECPLYAYLCNNPIYRNFLRTYCRKTCGYCSTTQTQTPCVDLAAPGKLSTCPGQKAYCTVPLYVQLMKQQCPKTCGYCT